METVATLVPIKLRPHLIPFFYKEFEGVHGHYLKERVKACKISFSSTLGFLIRMSLVKSDAPVKPEKYYVYISFDGDDPEAELYSVEKGRNCFLKVPEHVKERINDIFEDQFRMAFSFYCEGMIDGNKDLLVRDAIAGFMVKYELDEYGFDLESMRRILDRGKTFKLRRLQNKLHNRFPR